MSGFSSLSEPVFVNVYGAQESISPAYVAWRASTTNRVISPARQAGNRFPDSLKCLQIRALVLLGCLFLSVHIYAHCYYVLPSINLGCLFILISGKMFRIYSAWQYKKSGRWRLENISRGPTSHLRGFCDYPHREGSMQDNMVTRLIKCNVLHDSLSVDSQNIPIAILKGRGSWVISVHLCKKCTFFHSE